MSAEIVINQKTVLKTSAGVFATLYHRIEEVVAEGHLFLTPEMLEFMKVMKMYSVGCS